MEKITSLDQMRMAAAEAKNFSAQVAAAALEAIEAIEASKQDKLPGSAGQFVGFDQGGNAVPEAERKTGLFIITDAKAAGSDSVSKEYVDNLVGSIGTLLDAINGEVV